MNRESGGEERDAQLGSPAYIKVDLGVETKAPHPFSDLTVSLKVDVKGYPDCHHQQHTDTQFQPRK